MVQDFPIVYLSLKFRFAGTVLAQVFLNHFKDGAEFCQDLDRAGLVEASRQICAKLVRLPHLKDGLALGVVVVC